MKTFSQLSVSNSVIKKVLAAFFALSGIAFPVLYGIKTLEPRDESFSRPLAKMAREIRRPMAELQISNDNSRIEDLGYRIRTFESLYAVVRIRKHSTHENPGPWISQSGTPSSGYEKFLSRPYWFRNQIVREWQPKDAVYFVCSNTYTPDSIVLPDKRTVQFD